jgi:hypothetical protein
MVSAYTDDVLGFGLPITDAELAEFNVWRKTKYGAGAEDLLRSPGLRFLVHGKNKQGWWTYEDLSRQADDVLDLYEWLDTKREVQEQQLGEYDHSSGHSKSQDGGLSCYSFNKGVGGKSASFVRPSLLQHDACVGGGEASLFKTPDRKWSAEPVAGGVEVDCRVYKGDTHHSVFREGDPPPFLDLKRPSRGEFREQITKRRRPRGGEPYDEIIEVVHKGYVGELKGADQYLWERGLWFDKKETPAGTMAAMATDIPKLDPHERTEEWSQRHVLASLPDFEAGLSALEKKYIDRGEIPLFCAKGHPELAGKGVEFCWGVSKRNFRKINDVVAKHLHANIMKSFEVLDLATV